MFQCFTRRAIEDPVRLVLIELLQSFRDSDGGCEECDGTRVIPTKRDQ